ncbi:MAG: HlyD family efflux transporter periplasmic adaptor subunit [Pseudomonadota bacterium]
MRFLTRSLMGLFLLTLTFGLLGLAGKTMFDAYEQRQSRGPGQNQNRERVFSVEVATVTPGDEAPIITTFGEVISGRTLEVRAAAGGELVRLSENFREGGFVRKGELLFQTDPANSASRLAITENELAEATADLADARRQRTLAVAEVAAAEGQLALRKRAMERQDSLRSRGVGTDAAMETAELATASADQTLLSKKLSLSNAEARIARMETMLERRKINRDEAARVLADTEVRAEFDGVLAEVSVVLGRLVNPNERLGNLIDPDALEVSFRISNAEFQSLAQSEEGLKGAQVSVRLGGDLLFTAQIDRVSAAVGEGKTGRELFAKLGSTAMVTVRPGDFVSVTLTEPPVSGVARVPATAVSNAGEILLIGEGDRLEAATVEILRKQGDEVLIYANDIADRQIVLARAPQLGAGIKVKPRSRGDRSLVAREFVDVTPERAAPLIAMLEKSTVIPKAVQERLIKSLQDGRIAKEALDRMEARLATAGEGAEIETVQVAEDKRAQMIAFIQNNGRIPADRKTQIIETLKQDRLPKAMVDRITQRMGG